jgi:hypothetical protein
MIVDSSEFSKKNKINKHKRKDLLLYMAKKFQITGEGERGGKITPVAMPCHAMPCKRKEKKRRRALQ